MAILSKILLFPIKALDPVEVVRAEILKTGALRHDREFALLDAEDRFVNGKRNAKVHQLRSEFDLATAMVKLRRRDVPDSPARTFNLRSDLPALNAWLSDFFGFQVHVAENTERGFPDDTDACGPTLVSSATLQTVASWFPGLDPSSVGRRFRANLEIEDVPPFWEDKLYGEIGQSVALTIGGVRVEGVNPCQRCVVPSRNPLTGEALEGFSHIFRQRRQESLPAWANRPRFDHFYRLAVNTVIRETEAGKSISVGDEVRISG